VIALDMPEFAQRIAPHRPASAPQFAAQLDAVLEAHGVDSAVIVAHSLGTAYANYFRRYRPERVAALALIDPICCMIHHATISDAFVYRPVGPSVQIAAEEYFIRRELFTSNVLARHMRWHEASLWPQDCRPSAPTLLVLSEEDHIVPVGKVRACAGSWRAYARGVRVLTLPGKGHGGWIVDQSALRRTASQIRALWS